MATSIHQLNSSQIKAILVRNLKYAANLMDTQGKFTSADIITSIMQRIAHNEDSLEDAYNVGYFAGYNATYYKQRVISQNPYDISTKHFKEFERGLQDGIYAAENTIKDDVKYSRSAKQVMKKAQTATSPAPTPPVAPLTPPVGAPPTLNPFLACVHAPAANTPPATNQLPNTVRDIINKIKSFIATRQTAYTINVVAKNALQTPLLSNPEILQRLITLPNLQSGIYYFSIYDSSKRTTYYCPISCFMNFFSTQQITTQTIQSFLILASKSV